MLLYEEKPMTLDEWKRLIKLMREREVHDEEPLEESGEDESDGSG